MVKGKTKQGSLIPFLSPRFCTKLSLHSSRQKCSSRFTISQRSMASKKLGIDTIRQNPVLRLQFHIISAAELGKTPLPADNDLLATGELEFCTAESLLCMMTVAVSATNRQENLTNGHSCTSALWLTKCTPHTSLKPISSSTGKHFVDAQDMERMNANPQMEGILASTFGHVFVASNSGSLKCFTGHVLLFPGHQVDTEWELINSFLLHANIVNPNLRIRHTTAKARFWVWFVLDLAIAPSRSYRNQN
uniref:Uncharacterized protein MANES_02G217700 n=1 Tax=Rhizophora mucronata TaxID=61149 RepID=A0A2P2LQR2_RHIMU